ncbi:MAG: hypothetical protein COX62_08270 [Deltaproteobacteria bacterium CG_4_10_14_0_2_um_filter_43_8]|nr:MAG: hypothetical protein COV43_09265 [Deltaproteobacteria bacterium CG11_big_fil_rev_8_21_14_0_20_42_23]PJA18756.1 MAG: hypothetical protein COX62_08270 [Deltaproteobacteria bacterium CG_4_10_14_0_2_um_filter_43_8]PJC64390.1 MAG: hypothetical protein CO021_05140 [Deltaproteobacteria bacterium CG_4_9_14_0_2_um_filter_42_21]
MSTTINKYNPSIRAIETPEAEVPEKEAWQNAALSENDALMKEIEQFRKENAEWLDEQSQHDLDRLSVTLRAENAAISGYGIEGGAGVAGVNPADFNPFDANPELVPGWNGHFFDRENGDNQAYIESNPEYGEYAGTVAMENKGSESESFLIFSLKPTDRELYVETKGNDLIFTVVGKNGKKRSYVLEDGVTHQGTISIDATQAGAGVTIDASRAIRIGQSDGFVSFYIHGSEYDDTIKGSQGNDKIAGFAGNDKIDGMGGDNLIWGDEYYKNIGDYNSAYGGSDIIRGGSGNNIIYGGGGDDVAYTSGGTDSVSEVESKLSDQAGAIPSGNAWARTSDEWLRKDENGRVVFSNASGNGGEINLNMQQMDGYNMASAQMDEHGDLIITFVGTDETGNTKSFEVVITDFNGPWDTPLVLNINGSAADDIIDFSKLKDQSSLDTQIINIKGGAGNDLLLGAESHLLHLGLDLERITTSQGQTNQTLHEVAAGIVADGEGNEKHFRVDVSEVKKIISVRRTSGNKEDGINLVAPRGYNQAYILESGNGDHYVVFVKPGVNGEKAQTIVIRVDEDAGDIHITGKDGFVPTVQNLSFAVKDGFVLDGGVGNDVLAGQSGSRFSDDARDTVLKDLGLSDLPAYTPPPASPEAPASASTPPAESADAPENEEDDPIAAPTGETGN